MLLRSLPFRGYSTGLPRYPFFILIEVGHLHIASTIGVLSEPIFYIGTIFGYTTRHPSGCLL